MEEKINILHLWTTEADAQSLVSELASSGLQFEAKLVKTHQEYVSSLVSRTFDLVIADERAEISGTGTSASDDLSLHQIADEIRPGIPFLLLCDSLNTPTPSSNPDEPFFRFPRLNISGLGQTVRSICSAKEEKGRA